MECAGRQRGPRLPEEGKPRPLHGNFRDVSRASPRQGGRSLMRASARERGGRMEFRSKYGPWALVAGATEGIGRAFSLELARRGCSLVLLARRAGLLSELASELTGQFKIEVRTLAVDLGSPDVIEQVRKLTDGIEVGL